MGDPSPMGMLDRRQDRLDERITELEQLAEEVPVLRKEVALLREAFDRNTSALYTAATSILGAGVLAVVAGLVVKGVVG